MSNTELHISTVNQMLIQKNGGALYMNLNISKIITAIWIKMVFLQTES